MKKGWAAVLNDHMQNDHYTSFIGGLPKIPEHITLPKCQVCGEPLTFFFQVDFPEGHIWKGKTLALFACIHIAENHDDYHTLPKSPQVGKLEGCDLSEGFLDENYQDIFRIFVFSTDEGVLRRDYEEQIIFRDIEWIPINKKDKKAPILLAGEPIWLMHKEHPATYAGIHKMHILLQVAEEFNFAHLNHAQKQREEDFFSSTGEKTKARETNDYTLFYSFNRIYIFGADGSDNPKPFIIVQNKV